MTPPSLLFFSFFHTTEHKRECGWKDCGFDLAGQFWNVEQLLVVLVLSSGTLGPGAASADPSHHCSAVLSASETPTCPAQNLLAFFSVSYKTWRPHPGSWLKKRTHQISGNESVKQSVWCSSLISFCFFSKTGIAVH